MKITYHISDRLTDEVHHSELQLFLEQYRDRFPWLDYLHLEFTEDMGNSGEEMMLYSGDGRCLKIGVAAGDKASRPSAFGLYEALLSVFDRAVTTHLETHAGQAADALFNRMKELL